MKPRRRSVGRAPRLAFNLRRAGERRALVPEAAATLQRAGRSGESSRNNESALLNGNSQRFLAAYSATPGLHFSAAQARASSKRSRARELLYVTSKNDVGLLLPAQSQLGGWEEEKRKKKSETNSLHFTGARPERLDPNETSTRADAAVDHAGGRRR